MKLAIIGSRQFDNFDVLTKNVPAGISEIISGGAKGADMLAERFADENKIPKKIFLPKFKTDKAVKYHPSYFHIRNREIVDYADEVLAFMPEGGSKGTQSTISYAKKTGVPYRIINF